MDKYQETGFPQYVTGADRIVTYVVSAHLWLEHLLIACLETRLPRPEVFREKTPPFKLLVALCEAHDLIPSDFARVLDRVNAMRNKFAHRLAYRAADREILDLQRALRELESPFHISGVEPSKREMAILIAAVCGHLERIAREHGC